MITVINAQNKDKYNILFDEASKALGLIDDKGKPDAIKGIHDLETYFSKIGDLKTSHGMKFVNRLPIDEPAFEINANSRVINVPQNFKVNGISVQGDTYAETLIFKINRFVDAMDLSNDDIKIYAQWKLPDGTEGASVLTDSKDWDWESGYMYFFWPLSGKLTEQAGTIQASIRFFNKPLDEILYSFNTLPITLNIKTALHPALEYSVLDEPSQDFKRAITNSTNLSSGVPVQKPVFLKGFKEDGREKVYIPESGNLVLEVQACTTDTGIITYKWEHIKDKADQAVSLISKLKYTPTEDKAAKPGKKYYVKTSEPERMGYEPHLFDTGLAEKKELFEESSIYTVPDTTGITGAYKAIAINTIRADSKASEFTMCRIPSPEILNFKKNLVKDTFISDNQPLTVEMEVDQVPAGARKPSLTYSWTKIGIDPKGSLEAITEPVEGSTNTLTAQEAGWYKVKVTSTLNGDKKIENSSICRVLNDPIAPTFNASSLKGGTYTKANVKSQITVGFEGLDTSNKLLSDSIKYEWYDGDALIQPGDPNYTYVTGLDTNTLRFDWSKKTQILPDAWRCKITNTLNGKTAVTDFSGYFIITES